MSIRIEDDAVVLFQGDSITDAGRTMGLGEDLGQGYVMMASALFSAICPEKRVRFVNRGISGNRVKDLRARWQEDCLDLTPTWVSIMIGVNDTWRRFDSNDPTGPDAFEADYRAILEQVRDGLDAQLILIEPFLLPVPEDRLEWRADLDPKIDAVRRLAQEFSAILIPMDGVFQRACAHRSPAFWAPDGVHPTPPGHAMIAKEWLRAVGVEAF